MAAATLYENNNCTLLLPLIGASEAKLRTHNYIDYKTFLGEHASRPHAGSVHMSTEIQLGLTAVALHAMQHDNVMNVYTGWRGSMN